MHKETIDFIGIGAAKCGSTWVAHCLMEHPQVLMSSHKTTKETNFFNQKNIFEKDSVISDFSNYDKGLDWYFDQFPKAKDGFIRGEVSVPYLTDEKACERIKQIFPDVKLIVTLRNPVEMLYSLHWYTYQQTAVRISKDFKDTLKNEVMYDKAMFFKHLKKFYETFDKNQIHVILVDDIKKDNLKTIQDLYRFLEIDGNYVPKGLNERVNKTVAIRFPLLKDFLHMVLSIFTKLGLLELVNKLLKLHFIGKIYTRVNKVDKTYPKMSDEERKLGIDLYKKDVVSLEKLIERDLSSWKK